jgi:CCR4-NOT transcriptional complex subunit CAF120
MPTFHRNTAGLNRILLACPAPQSLLSWTTALRLAAWEKSRLEEIYTGHLLRLSTMETGPLREPKSTLQGGRMEGWAKVRIGGGSTEWQRVWVVIFQHSPASMEAGWPDLSAGPVKNRFSTLLSGTECWSSIGIIC